MSQFPLMILDHDGHLVTMFDSNFILSILVQLDTLSFKHILPYRAGFGDDRSI